MRITIVTISIITITITVQVAHINIQHTGLLQEKWRKLYFVAIYYQFVQML